jgi:hypothetical protein
VALSPKQTRRFVVAFLVVVLGLSALATVLITRGWQDEDLQEQVSEMEDRRQSELPRLGEGGGR